MSQRLAFAAAVTTVAIALGGCVGSSSTSTGDGGAAPGPKSALVPPSASGPTIATIRTRDGLIAMTSSPRGLRVTLATAAGEVTAEDLTLEQLRAQSPDAYQLVTTSRAYVDASIDSSVLERGSRTDLIDPRGDVPGAAPQR